MDRARLSALLTQVAAGSMTPDAAVDALRRLPFEALGDLAKVDHHRELRSGIPEVVLGDSKSAEEIIPIVAALADSGSGALATRVNAAKAREILARFPRARYIPEACALVVDPDTPRTGIGAGRVAVVSAGTSDRLVAMEALETLKFLGHETEHHPDIGVAGLQRVVAATEALRVANVIIAVAGMEGALPGVLASLIDRPIIAVPTSVGYGVGLGGFVAMLAMLASCSPGVTVVNIDNGFGAAVAAARMNRRASASARGTS